MKTVPYNELQKAKYDFEYYEDFINQPAHYAHKDGWILYQPVEPYNDAHGVVVAHLVIWNETDSELSTDRFYSRPWAYWNFIDHTDAGDFENANWAMAVEQANDYLVPDHTISIQSEAVNSLNNDTIPHNNPYWQNLVIRTAYSAITNVEEFAKLCKSGNFTQQEVQRMIDLAIGAVLQNPNYTITGFTTQTV